MWSVWPVPTAVLCDQLQYTNILYKIITNLKWDRKFEIQKSNMCRQAQMFYSLFFYLFLFYIHCVWSTRLCKSTWGHCSIYNRRLPAGFSYRRLYLQLDEGCLTFNANPQEVTHAQTSKIFSHIGTHSIPGSAVCVCVCVCVCACMFVQCNDVTTKLCVWWCHYFERLVFQQSVTWTSKCVFVCVSGSLDGLRPL